MRAPTMRQTSADGGENRKVTEGGALICSHLLLPSFSLKGAWGELFLVFKTHVPVEKGGGPDIALVTPHVHSRSGK